MKVERFEVVLDRGSNEPHISGEILKGTVEICANDYARVARLAVKITGYIQTSWRNKISDILYESNEQILNEYIDLTRVLVEHCDDNYNLTKGYHKIAFQAQLPVAIASSLEKENYGWVRYSCSATLDVLDVKVFELFADQNFVVHSLLNLDAPYMREAASKRVESEVYSICFRRKIGIRWAEVTIAEMGLLPGETTRITVKYGDVNSGGKQKKKYKRTGNCCMLSLCQQIDFASQNRYELDLFDWKSLTVIVESITVHINGYTEPEANHFHFTVPTGLQPTSILDKGLITISYFFKLDANDFDVIVPIIIGSVKTLEPI